MRTCIILIYLLLVHQLIAQKSVDDNLVQLGMEVYNFGDKKDALDVFLQACDVNPSNSMANYMAGTCYLETAQKFLSVKYFIRAYELNSKIAPDILFKIAKGYHLGANFEDAIRYYNQYKSELTDDMAVKLKSSIEREYIRADRCIFECTNAMAYYRKPLNYIITPLSNQVNTEYHEYAPIVNEDQTQMIFTSRRSGGTSADKDIDNDYYEDVYITRKVNNTWGPAKNIGKSINSPTHDGSIGFSANGSIMFIYKPSNGGDIFYSQRASDSTWGELKSIGAPINSKYNEPSVCISKDGNTLFFSSNRPGGLGGFDIYKSERQFDGKWGAPQNLGASINTDYDEDSPFLSPDGRYLYFSSKGHKGMGEYDIYRSELIPRYNSWTVPENMGYPINSPDNDIYFVIAGDNKTAYYASAKEGSLGGNDIFMINLNPPVIKDTVHKGLTNTGVAAKQQKGKSIKPKSAPVITNTNQTLFKSRWHIVDESSGKPVDVAVSVSKIGTNEEVKTLRKTNDGSYELQLEPGYNYAIQIQKEGFLFYSENLDLTTATDNALVFKTITLQKIKKGNRIVLKNVFFDLGKTELKAESKKELDILYQMMLKNKEIRVEVSGHTDNTGTDEINNTISEQRAKSVAAYLSAKGIESARLVAKGYGKNRPIASNSTDEGKRLNRRTEFEILK